MQLSVWLGERVRIIDNCGLLPSFNMVTILKIVEGSLSIDRCINALNSIVDKHSIFRTRLQFDVKNGKLHQMIDKKLNYSIRISTIKSIKEEEKLINEELCKPIDTEIDGVFRFHFICYNHENDKDKLIVNDLLSFNFHHGSFDGKSMDIFFDEFKIAYKGEKLESSNLNYIDYSIYERELSMMKARDYWNEILRDYDWNRQLYLGETSRPLSSCRKGQGELLRFPIKKLTVDSMIYYTNKLNTTLFQLGLTCYYLFLCELSYDNRDACIGVIHLNRYREEIVSMIGMFVNILPCRISNNELDKLSFLELLSNVQKTFIESVEYSSYPYDELINLYRKPSKHFHFPYLQTIFSVDTTIIDYTNVDNILIDDQCRLSTYKIKDEDFHFGYKFDLDVSFSYDKINSTIDCVWGYMFDIFQRETIEKHADQFNHLLDRLFSSNNIEHLQIPLNQIMMLNNDKIINSTQIITKVFKY